MANFTSCINANAFDPVHSSTFKPGVKSTDKKNGKSGERFFEFHLVQSSEQNGEWAFFGDLLRILIIVNN